VKKTPVLKKQPNIRLVAAQGMLADGTAICYTHTRRGYRVFEPPATTSEGQKLRARLKIWHLLLCDNEMRKRKWGSAKLVAAYKRCAAAKFGGRGESRNRRTGIQ